MAARRKTTRKKATRRKGTSPKRSSPGRRTPEPDTTPAPPPRRGPDQPPRVVVFGAGITGLTVAHELVERGFDVQVVEAKPSDEGEYLVEVGGLAANQFAVVKAECEMLYPHLYPARRDDYLYEVKKDQIEDEDVRDVLDGKVKAPPKESVSDLEALRSVPMQRSQPPAGLNQVLSFDYGEASPPTKPKQEILELERFLARRPSPIKKAFLDLSDPHETKNRDKLDALAKRLAGALVRRAERLATDIAAAERYCDRKIAGKLDDATVRREILLVELWGHADPNLPRDQAVQLGLLRSRFVRRLLFDPGSSSVGEYLKKNANRHRLEIALAGIYDLEPAPDIKNKVDAFIAQAERHVVARSAGGEQPLGGRYRQRLASNRVQPRVVEVRLPGEHGYRYFPAFYRHLFDTMRRTPILDDAGEEGIETAFDRLVEPPPVGIALAGKPGVHRVPRRHTSLEELRRSLKFLREDLKLTDTDLQRFAFRLLVFLTSSRERRLRYEEQSWIEFLDGACDDHRPDYEMKHFSQRGQAILRGTLRALLAMDGDEIDAHSYALNSGQLLLDVRDKGAGMDMTLNGPSSLVWLRQWKRYLVQQGVQFFSGELLGVIPDKGALQPVVVWPEHWELVSPTPLSTPLERDAFILDVLQSTAQQRSASGGSSPNSPPIGIPPIIPLIILPILPKFEPRPENPDHRYFGWVPDRPADELADLYVLALPFEQASRIAWAAGKSGVSLDGDWEKLARFDERVMDRDEKGYDKVQYNGADPVYGTRRDPLGRPLDKPPLERSRAHESKDPAPPPPRLYPLRDLSGLQYFFANATRLSHGHVIYPESPWGLSAISQMSHWRDRRARREGFLGQFSVDLGDFYHEHFPRGEVVFRHVAQAHPEVGQQLAHGKTAWRSHGWEIPVRAWDQILGTLSSEHARALVPPRYYHIDEGIFFATPLAGRTAREDTRRTEDDIRMPAGNQTPFLINLPGQFAMRPGQQRESRRDPLADTRPMTVWHRVSNGRWVLAGTYMASYTRIMTMEASNESARHAVNAILHDILTSSVPGKYSSQGKLLGSFCDVFDPYDFEVDDFAPLKELDAALYGEGLPHLLEILGFERLLRLAGRRGSTGTALDALRRRLEQDWSFLRPDVSRLWQPFYPRDMLELLRGHQTGGDDLVGRCLDLCRGTSLEPALRLLVELIAYLAGLGSARY